jgi:hypothetical protein
MPESLSPGTIELTGQADFPACPCCGVPARRVWGNLIDAQGTTAYVVQWAPGTAGSHAVMIGLVFGEWGEGSAREARSHVAIEVRHNGQTPIFAIIDAAQSQIDATPLAARQLARTDVLNGPLHARVLNYIEQIRVQDGRVSAFTSA